jgi:hypothetical protein
LIFFGKISKIRGNKGEVVCTLSPDFISLPCKEGEEVILKSEKYKKKNELSILKKFRV